MASFSPVNLDGNDGFEVPKKYKEHARLQVSKKLTYGSSPLATSSFTNRDLINIDQSRSRKLKMKKLSNSLFASTKSHKLVDIPENSSANDDDDVEMGAEDNDDTSSVTSSSTITPKQSRRPSVDGHSLSAFNDSSSVMANSDIQSSVSQYTANTASTNSDSLFSVISGSSSPSVVSSFAASPTMVTLSEALPHSFDGFYLLQPGDQVLPNGRPSYTHRDLIDWQVNDLRSLLIVARLKPEWHSQVPIIYSPPGFRVQYLPLDSSEKTIAQTLVSSDLYIERIKDTNFRYTVAKNTVKIAKSKKINSTNGKHHYLEEYELRNIIDNYMLNLAIEAQCQYEYKKTVSSLKKQRKSLSSQQLLQLQDSSSNQMLSQSVASSSKSNGSLLKKALINGSISNNTSKNIPINADNDKSKSKKLISKEELNIIWSQVQNNVYERAGLNWTPDKV